MGWFFFFETASLVLRLALAGMNDKGQEQTIQTNDFRQECMWVYIYIKCASFTEVESFW